jgi:hypothetical protein
MASNYTENYGLCQWEATDQVLREEFNQDNAKIDAKLNTLGQMMIHQKEVLEKQQGYITKLGNGQLYITNYTGDGETKTMSHTFPHKPVVVMIMDMRKDFLANGRDIIACQGKTIPIVGDNELQITWSGNTMCWFYSGSTEVLLNSPNRTYQIVAVLDMST